ncbi:MAG: hypothetical protein LBM77_03210 [Spirochaetaceae bacterium]|jgi:S-formylglutathione hydrolase FrmB|nr:hypothetical protein [Spirochaetaceae bacterium]
MSYFDGTVYSSNLGMDTGLTVILPQDCMYHRGLNDITAPVPKEGRKRGGKRKTMILLHGIGNNHTAWGHRSMILSYANAYDIDVIMPEGGRSFYMNQKIGLAYESYIFEELPKICHDMFGTSDAREDMILAGLSMGGFGALYGAMKFPHVFGTVAAFSAAGDLNTVYSPEMLAQLPSMKMDLYATFGSEGRISEDYDILALAPKNKEVKDKPRIYMACGTEDFLYKVDIDCRDALIKGGYDVFWEEWPGIHDWIFWDAAMKRMLKHFFNEL